MGGGTHALHYHTIAEEWTTQLLLYTTTWAGLSTLSYRLGGDGQRNSLTTVPYYWRAAGSGTPLVHCHIAREQLVAQLFHYTATLMGRSGHCDSFCI